MLFQVNIFKQRPSAKIKGRLQSRGRHSNQFFLKPLNVPQAIKETTLEMQTLALTMVIQYPYKMLSRTLRTPMILKKKQTLPKLIASWWKNSTISRNKELTFWFLSKTWCVSKKKIIFPTQQKALILTKSKDALKNRINAKRINLRSSEEKKKQKSLRRVLSPLNLLQKKSQIQINKNRMVSNSPLKTSSQEI